MKKVLIVGNGGRESSMAMKLAEDSVVCGVLKHKNPTILNYIEKTGGNYILGDTNDGEFILKFALSENIDIAFINSDEPLEAGVVDVLLNGGIKTVGPTRSGAEIEWNKRFAFELMKNILPEYTPSFWIANDLESLDKIFHDIEERKIEVVIKPQGLTAGKGVKVMGEHLESLSDAKKYSAEILSRKIGNSTSVIITEKLYGIEFTIMAFTDGKTVIQTPASYDYPYRFEGDKGPGTGGMGSFTDKKKPLPFMTNEDYENSIYIIEKVIKELNIQKRHFNGVLNAGFFLTKAGLKFMEFNARFGDPECMNIMTIMESSLTDLLQKIYDKKLITSDVIFKEKASVVKYLVAPEYAICSGKSHQFRMYINEIEKDENLKVFCSSVVKLNELNYYETIGISRAIAIAAIAGSIEEASEKIEKCITLYVESPLEHRSDIGSSDGLKKMAFKDLA